MSFLLAIATSCLYSQEQEEQIYKMYCAGSHASQLEGNRWV